MQTLTMKSETQGRVSAITWSMKNKFNLMCKDLNMEYKDLYGNVKCFTDRIYERLYQGRNNQYLSKSLNIAIREVFISELSTNDSLFNFLVNLKKSDRLDNAAWFRYLGEKIVTFPPIYELIDTSYEALKFSLSPQAKEYIDIMKDVIITNSKKNSIFKKEDIPADLYLKNFNDIIDKMNNIKNNNYDIKIICDSIITMLSKNKWRIHKVINPIEAGDIITYLLDDFFEKDDFNKFKEIIIYSFINTIIVMGLLGLIIVEKSLLDEYNSRIAERAHLIIDRRACIGNIASTYQYKNLNFLNINLNPKDITAIGDILVNYYDEGADSQAYSSIKSYYKIM